MNPFFDQMLAEGYRSRSQKIRVLTEAWVHRNLYCPRCGNRPLSQFPNNRAVADFFCPACRNQYELKSKGGPMGEKIADGAYETFLRRITSDSNPDFFILRYHASQLCVEDLWVIPKQFFTPAVVEKRKPLAASARRAGWVGCNILLGDIPRSGQIPMIRGRVPGPEGDRPGADAAVGPAHRGRHRRQGMAAGCPAVCGAASGAVYPAGYLSL